METEPAWPLLGRDDELETISALFEDETSRGAVLAGAAGVGKTRLAREAPTLEVVGCQTHWVLATRAAASIPFGAVSHLLPSAPSSNDRLQLLQRLMADLQKRGRRQRVAIAVDDAHLLDESSAALLGQVVACSLAFLVMTVRSAEPAPDAVTALWKDGQMRRLGIRPLLPETIDRLMQHALDGQAGAVHVDGVSAQRLRRAADGNPLMLRELLLAARESGALLQRDGIWRLREVRYGTARVVELAAGRLEAVSRDARAVLELIACGEPLSLGLVERVADRAALEAAERGGMVVVDRSAARVALRLGHPLYGEAIRASLPISRARAIWGQLTAALASGPMRRRDDALLAGVWQLQAGTVTHPGVLLAAARQAWARFDLRLAERLARAAREADASWEADRLLAEILAHRGRGDEAAAVLPAEPPEPGRRALWAVTRASILYWGLARTGEAEQALKTAPEVPGDGLTEATRSWILLFDGRCPQALEAARRVLDRPGEDEQAVVWAAASGAAAAGLLGRPDEAARVSERGLLAAGARGGELSWARAQVGYGTCLALYATGRLHQAGRVAGDGYRQALSADASLQAGGWTAYQGLVARARGRVASARRLLREAIVLLEDEDTYQLVPPCMGALAGAAGLAGDAAEAAAWLARADDRRREANRLFDPWIELDRAWALVPTGALSRAIDHAHYAARLAREHQQPAIEALALYDVARLGAPDLARSRLGELADTIQSAFTAALATAAAALADHDGARLERAATTFDDLGHLLLAAEAATASARASTVPAYMSAPSC
jgi:hypothetical protein